MKTLFKFSGSVAAFLGGVMALMPFNASAIDFDQEEMIDDIKYGIVGDESSYKAYVIATDMWEGEPEYEGEITIPESVEFDGKTAVVEGIDDRAFYSTGVTSVTLPNTIVSIGKNAFGLCGYLTSVKIGSGVKTIMSKAFFPDARLTTMFIDAVEPPAIAADALMNAPEKMTLYVPANAVKAYKNAEVWNKIGNILPVGNLVKVTEIKVSPSSVNVPEMGTTTLTATVLPANASQEVSWTSSDTGVARVSAKGEVFGIKNGICTITASATDGSGVKAECIVTVGSGKALDVSMPLISGFVGEEFTIKATVAPENTAVDWSVEDKSVASVVADGLSATIKLLSAGETVINVNGSNGLSKQIDVISKELVKLTAINVDPDEIECEVGDRISLLEFDVTAVPENASVFSPSVRIEDSRILDYDPDDFDEESFICLALGTTRLIWSQDGVEGYCTIKVAGDIELSEIMLTPESISGMYVAGDKIEIKAVPVPADASDFEPVWSSSNNDVATVDNSGVVTVVNPVNDVVIFCKSGNISASCRIHFESVGIDRIVEDNNRYKILTVSGIILMEDATAEDLENLIPGMYIVNGKKYIRK